MSILLDKRGIKLADQIMGPTSSNELPVTLLIRADEFGISQHMAMHCLLDPRFRRAF
jgi:hypothetical protein